MEEEILMKFSVVLRDKLLKKEIAFSDETEFEYERIKTYRAVRMDNNNITSVMQMEKIVFDKIEFNRVGFKNDEDINFEIQTHIAEHASESRYKVNLVVKGNKAKEYNLEISLTGFFNLKENSGLPKTVGNALISKNAVAILMPYMRSEITLLTAQPEVDSVSLPLFNINNMFEE